jgi:DNA-binding transcriptional ArsR family regulator
VPDVYEALANPVRRQLLDLLRDGPRPVVDVAGAFAMSRPAVSQHLRVLKEAGLVREQKVGRHRHYQLVAEPLREVDRWLEQYETFWSTRLRNLAEVLDEQAAREET